MRGDHLKLRNFRVPLWVTNQAPEAKCAKIKFVYAYLLPYEEMGKEESFPDWCFLGVGYLVLIEFRCDLHEI